jgi:CheY-like chemotaxis protein
MTRDNNFSNLSSVRVLYVEDDVETREELQYMLSNYVGELYTAKNGREGLALYRDIFPTLSSPISKCPKSMVYPWQPI